MRTLSRVSQGRMGAYAKLFRGLGLDGTELRDGGFIKQAEDDGEAFFRQLSRRDDVADYAGGGFEAALPAGVGAVAYEEILWFEARRHDHRACDALELAPAGGDTNEV